MKQLTGFVLVLIFFAFVIGCDDSGNSPNGEETDNGNSVITNNDPPSENKTDVPVEEGPEARARGARKRRGKEGFPSLPGSEKGVSP